MMIKMSPNEKKRKDKSRTRFRGVDKINSLCAVCVEPNNNKTKEKGEKILFPCRSRFQSNHAGDAVIDMDPTRNIFLLRQRST